MASKSPWWMFLKTSTPWFIMTCETSAPGLEEARRPARAWRILEIFQWWAIRKRLRVGSFRGFLYNMFSKISVYLIYLSDYLSIWLSIYLSIYLFIYIYTYLYICYTSCIYHILYWMAKKVPCSIQTKSPIQHFHSNFRFKNPKVSKQTVSEIQFLQVFIGIFHDFPMNCPWLSHDFHQSIAMVGLVPGSCQWSGEGGGCLASDQRWQVGLKQMWWD